MSFKASLRISQVEKKHTRKESAFLKICFFASYKELLLCVRNGVDHMYSLPVSLNTRCIVLEGP